MKLKNLLPTIVALALFSAFYSPFLTVFAQGTAFTYQGRLNASGNPANGNYDLQFALFDAVTNGNQITPAVTNTVVTVSNGLFTTAIDFGNVFNGSKDWLEIAVRTNGANSFAVLTPRQPMTPTPYALYANSASNVSGTISANQLSGAIPLAQLPSTVITNGASGINISGVFSGDGAGVTNVSANSLVITTTTNAPTIAAWGYNHDGQTNVPAGLSNIVAVATGASYSLAVKNDGTVIAWGDNSLGQTDVPADLSNVVAVASGYHSLALKNDGTIVAWGFNGYGETNVPAGLSNVVAVAAGAYHNLALKSDGTIVAWGFNGYGETNVPAGLSNVVAVAAGAYHNLALKSDGTIVAWGFNGYGQTDVPVGLSNIVAVAAGFAHSLALKSDGTIVAWGFNSHSQTNVPAGLSNVVAVAAGDGHNLALKSDGTVVAWGYNVDGETYVPVGLSNVVAVAAGQLHSLALKRDGTVIAWGNNIDGQTMVPAGLNHVIALAQGCEALHGLAIQQNILTPAALFNRDNTFNGNITVTGSLYVENNLAVSGTASAMSFNTTSDRNVKENFAPVNPQSVLDKVLSLPMSEWNFKTDATGQKHLGPMAQDFHAAFGLNGKDDKHISVVDEGGVALAAIQGLNQKLMEDAKAKDAEIQALKEQLNELQQTVQSLAEKK